MDAIDLFEEEDFKAKNEQRKITREIIETSTRITYTTSGKPLAIMNSLIESC